MRLAPGERLTMTAGCIGLLLVLSLVAWTAPAATASADRGQICSTQTAGVHTIYFAADDGVHGMELWATDGTAAGTRLVKDIDADGPSDPQLIGTMDDVLYFYADDGVHGREPWRSDGTAEGTWLLADLRAGPRDSAPNRSFEAVVVRDRLLFWAPTAPRRTLALWSTDGTTEGTRHLEPVPAARRLDIGPMTTSDGLAYVTLMDEDDHQHLWRSDGTVGGTWRLEGSVPLLVYTAPISARDHVISDQGYSVDRGRVAGWIMWSEDGLPDVAAGSSTEGLSEVLGLTPVTIVGGRLLFYADAGDGFSLWASDGSPAGTGPIGRVGPRRSDSHDLPEPLAVLGDRAILLGHDPRRGPSLWASDGTADGTRWLRDLRWADQEQMSWVVPEVDDRGAYLEARGDRSGRQVWRTDGTAKGTRRITDLPRGSRPLDIVAVDGQVYIAVMTSDRTPQLWTSDGTRRGTRLLKRLPKHPSFWTTPVFLDGTANGALFIRALRTERTRRGDGPAVFGLSTSDGTKRGTRLIKGVELHDAGHGPEEQAWEIGQLKELFAHIAVDGVVYFRNPNPDEPDRYAGLWRSDGSPAGTERIASIVPAKFLAVVLALDACPPAAVS